MCLGLFFVLHAIGEAFDGIASVSTRTGVIATYAHSENPDAFVRTLVLNILFGLAAIGLGYF